MKTDKASFVTLSSGEVIYLPVAGADKPDSQEDSKDDSINPKSQDVRIDKVHNVWGSSAGAGSDFFDIYRKLRYKEMDRLEKMDREWDASCEAALFQKKREKEIQAVLDKQGKRLKKRKVRQQKRKENIKLAQREEKEAKRRTKIETPNEEVKSGELHNTTCKKEKEIESPLRKTGYAGDNVTSNSGNSASHAVLVENSNRGNLKQESFAELLEYNAKSVKNGIPCEKEIWEQKYNEKVANNGEYFPQLIAPNVTIRDEDI